MDGTLAPCFPLYSASHVWRTVGQHKFAVEELPADSWGHAGETQELHYLRNKVA